MLKKLDRSIGLASAAIDWVLTLSAPSDKLSKLDIHLDGYETLLAAFLHELGHENKPRVIFEWQHGVVDADIKKLGIVSPPDPEDADLRSATHVSR